MLPLDLCSRGRCPELRCPRTLRVTQVAQAHSAHFTVVDGVNARAQTFRQVRHSLCHLSSHQVTILVAAQPRDTECWAATCARRPLKSCCLFRNLRAAHRGGAAGSTTRAGPTGPGGGCNARLLDLVLCTPRGQRRMRQTSWQTFFCELPAFRPFPLLGCNLES